MPFTSLDSITPGTSRVCAKEFLSKDEADFSDAHSEEKTNVMEWVG